MFPRHFLLSCILLLPLSSCLLLTLDLHNQNLLLSSISTSHFSLSLFECRMQGVTSHFVEFYFSSLWSPDNNTRLTHSVLVGYNCRHKGNSSTASAAAYRSLSEIRNIIHLSQKAEQRAPESAESNVLSFQFPLCRRNQPCKSTFMWGRTELNWKRRQVYLNSQVQFA